MTNSPVYFASLLCSRLCHDLMSPVGALNNGVELLGDEADPKLRAQYLELLADSARVTADKLKFFRLAFGAGGGFDDQVPTAEARAAVEGLFGGEGKVDLHWMVDEPAMDRGALKLLLNLALIGGDALVRGGALVVGAERHGGGTDVVVRAEGARVVLPQDIKDALEGRLDDDALAPRTAAAWLVRSVVDLTGGQLQVAEDEGMLIIGASLPVSA